MNLPNDSVEVTTQFYGNEDTECFRHNWQINLNWDNCEIPLSSKKEQRHSDICDMEQLEAPVKRLSGQALHEYGHVDPDSLRTSIAY